MSENTPPPPPGAGDTPPPPPSAGDVPPPPPGAGNTPPPPPSAVPQTTGEIPQQNYQQVPPTGSVPQYPGQQPAYGTGQMPAYGGQVPPARPVPREGFMQGLFDFSFAIWATPRVVKVIYVLTWVLVGVYVVAGLAVSFTMMFGDGFLLFAFADSTWLRGLLGFLNLLWTLASAVFFASMIRVVLERSLATIRIAEMLKSKQDSK